MDDASGRRAPGGVAPVWTINGFEVLAELGGGAHSRVFRVCRIGAQASSPQYALKILVGAPSGSAQAQVEFRREAAMLAGVAHPGLTVIHEVGEANGQPYLVMDLLDGMSLAQVLTGGALPVERCRARYRLPAHRPLVA